MVLFCSSCVSGVGIHQWHPTPVLLPGKSHGRGSLVGCSPWGRSESDTTERLHYLFSHSWIGEGTGNPLQCSCLENLRDGGAWWASVYGVAQSRTRLKRLSSSSSIHLLLLRAPPTGMKRHVQSTFASTGVSPGNTWTLPLLSFPHLLKTYDFLFLPSPKSSVHIPHKVLQKSIIDILTYFKKLRLLQTFSEWIVDFQCL